MDFPGFGDGAFVCEFAQRKLDRSGVLKAKGEGDSRVPILPEGGGEKKDGKPLSCGLFTDPRALPALFFVRRLDVGARGEKGGNEKNVLSFRGFRFCGASKKNPLAFRCLLAS